VKIGIAQTQPEAGNIKKNAEQHIKLIKQAIDQNVDLIVFPELSLTGYEPSLAKQLANTISDKFLNPFQELANNHEVTLVIGMPTIHNEETTISALIFQPMKKIEVYSKQILHADELPYFVSGKNRHKTLSVKGKQIGLGICYETLQRQHFETAHKLGVDIYIACVAKAQSGINKAYKYFPKIAKQFTTPILMANCVGFCDNFLSAGQSACWNNRGQLVKQLNKNSAGVMVYDAKTE
jgi:predicted amidohydrolase